MLMISGVAMTDPRSDALGLPPQLGTRCRPARAACLPDNPAPARAIFAGGRAPCPPPATPRPSGGIGIYKNPKNRAPLRAGEGESLPRGMGRESLWPALGVRGAGEKICQPGFGCGSGRS